MFKNKFYEGQFYKPKSIISGCNGIAGDLNFKLKKVIL